jgi:tRNA A37 threonylcarbamoyladenosine biosynthesis protein TsaE
MLVREYQGRLDVAHVDVYRLTGSRWWTWAWRSWAIGEAVLLVEWGDSDEELLPADHLTVELTNAAADSEARRIVLTPAGGSLSGRWEPLEHALAPWEVSA